MITFLRNNKLFQTNNCNMVDLSDFPYSQHVTRPVYDNNMIDNNTPNNDIALDLPIIFWLTTNCELPSKKFRIFLITLRSQKHSTKLMSHIQWSIVKIALKKQHKFQWLPNYFIRGSYKISKALWNQKCINT